MRKKLNENRTVQMAVLGVLAVAVALIFMMNMGGGGGDSDSADTGAPPPTAPPTGAEGSTADTGTGAPPVAGSEVPAATEAPLGPPLPKTVARSYRDGDTIALLVITKGGIEDRFVKSSLAALRTEGRVRTLVVDAAHVARYARLTQGVGVSRTPALVVVRPRWATVGAPVARVHYGYMGQESVRRAVRDAAFEGEPGSYTPG